MREYTKVSISIWNSKKFKSLTSDDARLAYFYFLTCPAVNSVGCFVIPDGYAAVDLGWGVDRYVKAIDSLSKAYLIAIDRDESVIRIINYLDHNPFTNPKHAIGAIRNAMALPKCEEKVRLFNDLTTRKYGAERPEVRAFLDSTSIGYRKAIDTTETETETKDKKEEEECARENPQTDPPPKPLSDHDRFFLEVLRAVGLDRGQRMPTHWMPPAASVHVNGWLGLLSEVEVLDCVKQTQSQFTEKPNGPKAFDAAVARLVAAKSAGPPAGVIPFQSNSKSAAGGMNERRRQGSDAITELARKVRSGEVVFGSDDSNPFPDRR